MGRSLNIKNIILLVLAITVLIIAVVCLLSFIMQNNEEKQEPETAVVDVEKAINLAGDFNVSIEYLQTVFPDYLVYSVAGEYKYQKLDPDIAKADYNYDLLQVNERGHLEYKDEKYPNVMYGIDVSQYQGEIDWPKVAADNIDFAFIRVGFRGYGSGKLVMDENFAANIQGAQSAGILVGVYFFSQAITTDEAKEEAAIVIEAIKDHDVQLPVVFDMEEIYNEAARTDILSPQEATEIALAFCKEVEKAGYKSMVYGNTKWLAARLDLELLKNTDIWFAQYYKRPLFPYDFAVWQYSNSGSVDGISTNVDMNIYFKPEL